MIVLRFYRKREEDGAKMKRFLRVLRQWLCSPDLCGKFTQPGRQRKAGPGGEMSRLEQGDAAKI